MGKLLKTRFSTAVVVLIPACIGMNYLGKFFATLLNCHFGWIPLELVWGHVLVDQLLAHCVEHSII